MYNTNGTILSFLLDSLVRGRRGLLYEILIFLKIRVFVKVSNLELFTFPKSVSIRSRVRNQPVQNECIEQVHAWKQFHFHFRVVLYSKATKRDLHRI